MWIGAGIATENVVATLAMNIPLVRAYLLRMDAEEAMLANDFPQEYQGYARRTWRLVPGVY
jgi:protein-S-isoprenylcysteine O-methyltransferase Ste14